eukprot:1933528-Pleurochrysis_carterae.AAC.1
MFSSKERFLYHRNRSKLAGVSDPSVLDAIDYFNADGGGGRTAGGGLTVFAAGNDGTNDEWYPAFYSGAVAVAGAAANALLDL